MDKNIFSCFYLLMFFQPIQFDIFLCFYPLIFFCPVRVCLEDSTERSESNPGRSLGIPNMK
mgnify:FL=1